MAPDDWPARRARSCGIPDTDQTGRAPRDERQREMTRQFREIARRQLSYHLQRRRDRHLRQGWGGPPYVPAGAAFLRESRFGQDHRREHPLPWWRTERRRGRLRRASDGRLIGGVAEGLSRRIGVDVTIVRLGFVLATLAGFGLGLYMLAWLLVPSDTGGPSIASRAISDRRGLALVLALVPVIVVVLLLASALRAGWLSSFIWPVFIAIASLVLIWRNAPGDERVLLERAARPVVAVGKPGRSLTQVAVWALAGAGAVAGGLALLLEHPAHVALRPIGGVLLVLAGATVILGPWWLRIARDLVVERQARARAEERADLAARLHDSVLQTLALIQRRADQPGQVTALARAQERELRSWLFGGWQPGSLGDEATTFAAGIACIQRDVEAAHGMQIEAVTVGDCPLDDDVAALLAATREATVNAAKWSGAPSVSIFAEADDLLVSVFVRDRGKGFDPAAVPPDRKGLTESIEGRMGRHGGRAAVRSAAGAGTEVVLELPRASHDRRERHGSAR
ncbi:MAG: PspC domain-containing protein [Actinomycetota bacterium]|nr:PspC domain-containing protein [Actinomycetota bacterium]